MPEALLLTKLFVPPARLSLVPRPRLIERLNQGLQQGSKLTLISAPAGYGKSTVLSEWARQTPLPAGWLSLDKRDNNPFRFWAYFAAALRTIPGLVKLGTGATLQNALTVQQLPPVEELLVELVNEIAALPGRYLLVFDDLHVINEATIHDGLLFLLDYMPKADRGLHLVVSSRSDPPWPLARFRVRGDLVEMREHDLRFTADEVTTYLNQAMSLALSPEDIENLDQRTEGWIAGLQMAAISLLNSRQELGEEGISKFIARFSGSHHFVLDFLVEEVLDRQLADVQAFLLKTAILERMSAPLVEAVAGIDDGQAALALVEKHNLFLLSLDDNRNGSGIITSSPIFCAANWNKRSQIWHLNCTARPASGLKKTIWLTKRLCMRWQLMMRIEPPAWLSAMAWS